MFALLRINANGHGMHIVDTGSLEYLNRIHTGLLDTGADPDDFAIA